jgi:hypothetical protein
MKKIYLVAFAMLINGMAIAQNFTAGNLVVYRAGDGTAAVGNTGTAVFLDEYNSSGTLIQSLAMPTSVSGANKRLVCVGNSTTEGFLTLSTDKQFIVATGYDAATATASLGTSTSATVARVVARIDATKTINTTTALTNGFSGAAVRGVCSNNGTDFWLAGGNTGSIYATLGGTTATTISGTATNLRNTYIFDNQLYISTGGGTGSRAQKVGTGLPTTTGQVMTSLTGVPTSGSVNGFFLADMNTSVAGVDVLYVANDGAGTGLQKYITTDGINWTASGNISASLIRGLTARVLGTDVELYATTTTNTMVKFTDVAAISSNISAGSFTTIATAVTNTLIKGICFAPESPTTPTLTATPNSFSITTAAGTASATQLSNLSGLNLTGAPGVITVTPSAGVEVSPDGTTWTANPATININYTTAILGSTPLYTRIAANAIAGAFTGTVICAGGGGSATVNITGGVVQNFYSQPTGNLSTLATWGIATNGTGTTPIDFTSSYQIFNVVNRAAAVPGTHWEVSGTGSKLVIGDGAAPTTVSTSIADTILSTTIIDIKNLGILEIGSRVAPTFGNLATGSTVNYNFNGTGTTDTVKINTASYHHLILKNGLKYLKSGTTTVNGNLVYDGTVNSNGAASPFSTISLKGNLTMLNAAVTEDSTTGSTNRFTLSMAGTGAQLIDASFSELKLFRLIRDTTILSNVDITVTTDSKITLGNNTSGGLSLLQKVSVTPTITRLILNSNAQLAIVKNGIVFTDATKAGKISSVNGKIIMNKSITSTSNPGTLVFEPGSTLNDLTVNITTSARDSVVINGTVGIAGNVNLTKGVIVLTPATTIIVDATATITGGSAASYIDGKIRKVNPSASIFLFPTGQAKQYAPVEMSGLTALSDFTVQYFKQAYSNLSVNPATSTAIPGYSVSTKEYWNIDRTGTSNPNIKFYYNSGSLVDGSQAKIAHFNGVDWDDIGRDSYGADVNGNFIAQNTISTFSPFTFGGAAGVLPILLQSFNGTLQNNTSTLQWKTSCEFAGDKFELQYSTDGINFVGIYTEDAIGTCVGNLYSYMHTDAKASVNYYRLVLKTIDGSAKFSNIIALKSLKKAFDIKLVSTNTNEQLCYSISAVSTGNAIIRIANMQGQLLLKENVNYNAGTQINYINTNKLSKGMYLISIVTNGGEVFTEKFIR